MLDRTAQYNRDDLHITVRMRSEAFASDYFVIIAHTHDTEARILLVKILSKRKAEMTAQPS